MCLDSLATSPPLGVARIPTKTSIVPVLWGVLRRNRRPLSHRNFFIDWYPYTYALGSCAHHYKYSLPVVALFSCDCHSSLVTSVRSIRCLHSFTSAQQFHDSIALTCRHFLQDFRCPICVFVYAYYRLPF